MVRFLAEVGKMKYSDRQVIGLTEMITVIGASNSKKVAARIDTGATKSSIDHKLAIDLDLGPILRTAVIRSANGRVKRPVIKAKIQIGDSVLNSEFTLADRKHMKYRILIGQDILKQGFIIDPLK